MGLIPGWERFPGGGHGHPGQHSCLENPMDREVWWATGNGVTKHQTGHNWSMHVHRQLKSKKLFWRFNYFRDCKVYAQGTSLFSFWWNFYLWFAYGLLLLVSVMQAFHGSWQKEGVSYGLSSASYKGTNPIGSGPYTCNLIQPQFLP